MSYNIHMQNYEEPRVLLLTDHISSWKKDIQLMPVMIEVSPTHNCNQKCRYCYSTNMMNSNSYIDVSLLNETFIQASKAGVKSILLQGTGEPLLHPSINKIISNAHKSGLVTGLTTNGVLLDKLLYDDTLDYLFQIKFSVLENNADRYAFLHGTSDKQLKVVYDNIEKAINIRTNRKLNLALWGTIYIYKDNINDIYDIAKCYKDVGLDYIVIQEPTYTSFSPTGKDLYVSENMLTEDIEQLKLRLMSLSDDNFKVKVRFPINDEEYKVGVWKENFCHGINLSTLISSEGEVYPCWRFWGNKEFSYGSIYSATFEEIWNGDKRKQVNEYLLNTQPDHDECDVCNLFKTNTLMHKCINENNWKYFIAG